MEWRINDDSLSEAINKISTYMNSSIRLNGFNDDEFIQWVLLGVSLDHVKVKVLEWEHEWLTLNIDLNVIWGSNPKVKSITCWSDEIEFFDGEFIPNNVSNLSVTDEFVSNTKDLVASLKVGRTKQKDFIDTISSMGWWVELVKILKSKHKNGRRFLWPIISLMQNNSDLAA